MTYTLTLDHAITTCRDCPCLQMLPLQADRVSWYCAATCCRVDRAGTPPQTCPMREVGK